MTSAPCGGGPLWGRLWIRGAGAGGPRVRPGQGPGPSLTARRALGRGPPSGSQPRGLRPDGAAWQRCAHRSSQARRPCAFSSSQEEGPAWEPAHREASRRPWGREAGCGPAPVAHGATRSAAAPTRPTDACEHSSARRGSGAERLSKAVAGAHRLAASRRLRRPLDGAPRVVVVPRPCRNPEVAAARA